MLAILGCDKKTGNELNLNPVYTIPDTLRSKLSDGDDFWPTQRGRPDSLIYYRCQAVTGNVAIAFRLNDRNGESVIAIGNQVEVIKTAPDGREVILHDRGAIFAGQYHTVASLSLTNPLPSNMPATVVRGADKWSFVTSAHETLFSKTVVRIKTERGYLPPDTFVAEFIYDRLGGVEYPYDGSKMFIGVFSIDQIVDTDAHPEYKAESMSISRIWCNGKLVWECTHENHGCWPDAPEIIK